MELSVGTTMPIMLSQILAMFLMMATGAALYRGGLINDVSSKGLANIAVYVATPAVILKSLATTFDAERLAIGGACAVLSVVFTFVCAGVARAVYGKKNAIAQVGITISNMGFIGIPLVQFVVGEEYVFYVSACMASQIFITWSYAVYLIAQDKSVISLKRILTNPAVLSAIVGVVAFICSYTPTGAAKAFIDAMASLNTGIAMLVLGVYLAQSDLRALAKTLSLYMASFLRLVVTSLLILAILLVVPIPRAVKIVLLIGFSAPCGTVSAIFSQLFGGDYRYGAGLVVVSTLLSMISMPVMLFVGLLVL